VVVPGDVLAGGGVVVDPEPDDPDPEVPEPGVPDFCADDGQAAKRMNAPVMQQREENRFMAYLLFGKASRLLL
jgi:hypothetical protein